MGDTRPERPSWARPVQNAQRLRDPCPGLPTAGLEDDSGGGFAPGHRRREVARPVPFVPEVVRQNLQGQTPGRDLSRGTFFNTAQTQLLQ